MNSLQTDSRLQAVPLLPSHMGHMSSSECAQQICMSLLFITSQHPVICHPHHLQHVLSAQKTEVRPMVHFNSASNLLSSQPSGHLAHKPSGSLTQQDSGSLAHQTSELR